ncbi:uncharacterized protein LOC134291645 [Aedes albopictus]|uniref:Integrase catalytic domain-containing protein n=1 Tax=Aedes albopictus TaxID=7160 RepID=A0ABM2A278_AEDAL
MSHHSHQTDPGLDNASNQIQGVPCSTPTEKCNVCSGTDLRRVWHCNICRYWYHPACIGIDSVNENPRFVCPQCQPLTGALKHTYTSAPSRSVPVSTTPLEYVNMSWSQISPVTTAPSTVPISMTPYALGYPRTTMSVNPIASVIPHAATVPQFSNAFPNTFPTVSSLARTLPPCHISTPPSLISQPPAMQEAAVSATPASVPEPLLPPYGFAATSLINQTSMRSSGVTPAATTSATVSNVAPAVLPHCGFPAPVLLNQQLRSMISSTTAPVLVREPLAISTTFAPIHLQSNNSAVQMDSRSQSSRATSSRLSAKQKQKKLELEMLDEERKLQEKEEANKREYLRKRYELLQEIASETSSVADINVEEEGPNERVNSWLQSRELENHTIRNQEPALQVQQQTSHASMDVTTSHRANAFVQNVTYSMQPERRQSYVQDDSRAPPRSIRFANASVPTFDPMLRSTPRQMRSQMEYGNNLSHSQVAARQAVSRELPNFSGSPEEWPLFYSTFISTTDMCGYTQEENLIRLQKCRREKAYDAVKCRLMHPTNVPGIIATLKMLYGNPEVIIHNSIAKIHAAPAPKADKLDTVIDFALTVQNLCATIEACELLEYTYNVALLKELVDKLPPSLKLDWAKHRRTLATVHLTAFADWLYDLAETLCPIATLSVSRTGKGGPAFLNAHCEESDTSSTANHTSPTCPACKGNCVNLDKCQRFLELGYNSRWTLIKEAGNCRKCLKKHKAPCKSQKVCGKNGCSFKHHPLLHNSQRDGGEAPAKQDDKLDVDASDLERRGCNAHHNPATKTLFRVVPVMLYSREKVVKTYAFLDDGSSWTLMDAELAAELNVDGERVPICLKWTGDKHRYENNSRMVEVDISGIEKNSKKYPLGEVHTVPNLGLFHQSLCMNDLAQQYSHLKGIPAESYRNIQPRLLIGVNNANLGHPQKGREGRMHEPLATKTRLGWIVHGGSDGGVFTGYHSWNIGVCNEDNNDILHRAMQEYFLLDSLGISRPNHLIVSADNQRAQDILQTMSRTENGRFVTRLLWKFDEFRLPNSKPTALQRLRCLEARLKREPELAEAMQQKIEDYMKKGYIRRLTAEELLQTKTRVWYLPIFPVFNTHKPGKLRIVWDAAAKSQGVSLNTLLLKGPDQLTSLNSVLFQFREGKVAICGDIREMFHQTLVHEDDQHCQRFLWREHSTDQEPSTFLMQVMTFGASCSPSCAQYAKNLNAKEFEGEYPEAADAITKKHYVDDMLASVETENEAIKLALDVRHVHAQAGYEMRNWLSNSPIVLNALNADQDHEKSLNLNSELATEKILGMWWCTSTDTFTYKLSPKHDIELLSGKRSPTKREMLRTLMAIFDPLGLISNLLIFLKILLQEVWRSAVGWDEDIPESLNAKWELWLQFLSMVQSVRIPRCFRTTVSLGEGTNVQLHTFVDASEFAYAAVAYLRFEQNGKVECAIVSAKARVAPLRFVSIPRLELQAAVIGSRLAETIASSLSLKIDERVFWTDSRDALCWIRSDHRRYSQFVAFRVSELLETTTISSWRWVSSKENVADEATKWQGQPDLDSSSRWLNGPDFLYNDREYWPTEPTHGTSTKEELRAQLFHHGAAPAPVINFNYFGTWERLLRVTARLFRYTHNLRQLVIKQHRIGGPLSKSELQRAWIYLFQQVQLESYPEEINVLSASKENQLPKSSAIYAFTPFMDDNGIVRMRGRIGNCEFATMDVKNPIILPKNHHVTRLILMDFHVRYHHANHETVINEVRQVYRIPKLRLLYKSVRSDCQQCKNERAKPNPPIMGDLPEGRLAAFTRPFSFVGVDYFGPMYVTIGRRLEKRWGVLITCLTARAIHVEIAHSLNADSCIMALRNFMARRGVPTKIYSDRGTNFVASSKELNAALKEMNQDHMIREIVSPHTEWEFLPPASPHMGGCWERLVRSVKVNLEKMKPQRNPSDEVLRNTLTEIENIVNSRPLTFVSVEDPDDPVLTPNHLLLGSSSGLKPAAPLEDSGRALKRAWRASQAEANLFWRRWVRYYLPDLTRRSKWYNKVKPISVNDVVVVVDPGLPRNCWPLGRIISVRTGKDQQVRVATVQTKNGIYERPATKLAVLDVRRDGSVSQTLGVPGGDCNDPSVGASHYIGRKSHGQLW